MANIFKKIFNQIFRGLHSADKLVIGDQNSHINSGIDNIQEMESHNVYSNLLKGELTQEVIEMRYQTYEVLKKSNDFTYIGNGVTKRKKNRDLKIKLENPTDLEILLVQDNKQIIETSEEAKEQVNWTTNEVNVAGYKNRYVLNIERDFTPKFRLEEFTTKLVVKKLVEDKVELNFYIAKYPKRFEPRSALFLREIKRIIEENKLKSNILFFDKLWFITDRAYGANDLCRYSYIDIQYFETTEFDGSYVLKFIASTEINGEDMTEKFFDAIAAKKYEEKAAKKNNSILSIENVEETNIISVDEQKIMEDKIKKYKNK